MTHIPILHAPDSTLWLQRLTSIQSLSLSLQDDILDPRVEMIRSAEKRHMIALAPHNIDLSALSLGLIPALFDRLNGILLDLRDDAEIVLAEVPADRKLMHSSVSRGSKDGVTYMPIARVSQRLDERRSAMASERFIQRAASLRGQTVEHRLAGLFGIGLAHPSKLIRFHVWSPACGSSGDGADRVFSNRWHHSGQVCDANHATALSDQCTLMLGQAFERLGRRAASVAMRQDDHVFALIYQGGDKAADELGITVHRRRRCAGLVARRERRGIERMHGVAFATEERDLSVVQRRLTERGGNEDEVGRWHLDVLQPHNKTAALVH